MRAPTGVLGLTAALAALSACTSLDPAEEASPVTTVGLPAQTVAVPPERESEFCVAMIELTDDLRAGVLDDVDAAILATYREVAPVAPDEIDDDVALVLDALERGAPPPTDPPRATVVTAPPETSATETGASGAPVDGEPDVGFAPGSSPTDRINSYIDFVCRATASNPGPPPTAPGQATVDESE